MRIKTLFFIITLTIGFQSCTELDCCVPADLNDLPGDYLVYEYGYSPLKGTLAYPPGKNPAGPSGQEIALENSSDVPYLNPEPASAQQFT